MFFNGNLLITVSPLDMLYIACWQKDFAKKWCEENIFSSFHCRTEMWSSYSRRPRCSWNQSLLCDCMTSCIAFNVNHLFFGCKKSVSSIWSMYSGEGKCLHTAAKANVSTLLLGTVSYSSIDVRILYCTFDLQIGLHYWMPFLKAIPQQILDIGKVHNCWILKGPANNHKCQ
jgi:hypothetical protein